MGVAQDIGTDVIFERNSFDRNTYHVTDLGAAHFAWSNRAMDFADFQTEGQEIGGSIDTSVAGRSWSCGMQ